MRIRDWSSDVCSSDLGAGHVLYGKGGLLLSGCGSRGAILRRATNCIGDPAASHSQHGHSDTYCLFHGYFLSIEPWSPPVDGERQVGDGKSSEERRVGKECVSTC